MLNINNLYLKYLLILKIIVFCSNNINGQITRTWANPDVGGSFATASNWIPNGVPTNGDSLVISPTVATLTITNWNAVSLSIITINSDINTNVTFTATTNSTINVTNLFDLSSNVGVSFTVGNRIFINVTNNAVFSIGNNSQVLSSSTSNFLFDAGATLKYDRDGGTIPTGGYNTNSTIKITGVSNTIPTLYTGTFGNFIWECANQTTNLSLGTSSFTYNGIFSINNTGGFLLSYPASLTFTNGFVANGGIFNISGGTYTITSGGFTINNGATLTSNTNIAATININSGNFICNDGSNFSNSATTAITVTIAGTGSLMMNNGSSITTQNTGANQFTLSGTTQSISFDCISSGFNNITLSTSASIKTLLTDLEVNNLVISAGVTLNTSSGQEILVNSNLTLGSTTTNGKLAGGANLTVVGTLIIAGSGAAIEANGNALALTGTIDITNGNITLSGTSAQTIGNGFPSDLSGTPGVVIISNSHASGATITKNLILNSLTMSGTSSKLFINSGITVTVNATTTLVSNSGSFINISGTFTQASGTITFGVNASVIGTGTFNLSAGALLSTANTKGITSSGSNGSVKTTTRNYSSAANYTFNATANYETGNGLPLVLTGGTVTIGHTTAVCTLTQATTFNNLTSNAATFLTANSPNHIIINGILTFSSTGNLIGSANFTSNSGSTLILNNSSANGVLQTSGTAAGNIQTTGTRTYSVNTNITLGTTAITTGNAFPTSIGIFTLNHTATTGALTAPLTVKGITISNTGQLICNGNNIITVNNASPKAVVRNGTGFLVGSMVYNLPANYNTLDVLLFPIGVTGIYQGFEIFSPVIDAGGTISIKLTSYTTAPTGGTTGTGLTGALSARHWRVDITGGGRIASATNVKVSHTGILASQKIGQSNTIGGLYNSVGGAFAGASLQSGLPLGSFGTLCFFGVATSTGGAGIFESGIFAIGPSGYEGYKATYPTIAQAVSDLAEYLSMDGPAIFELQADYDNNNETFPITFPSSLPSSKLNTITFRPAANLTTELIFNPTNGSGTAIFDINGGKFLILDGRKGGVGSQKFIHITNNGNGPALRLINDAQNNVIKHIIFKANATSATSGVVLFSNTVNSGILAGNSSNTIDSCNINANSVCLNGIYSAGSAASADNKFNTITNCRIYDFYTNATVSCGINIGAGNMGWKIGTSGNGNYFYQTATRVPTSGTTTLNGIRLNSTTITGFIIQDNYIGGNIPGIAGSSFNLGNSTLPNSRIVVFYGVYINVGSAIATSIQGNVISNINLFTSATAANTNTFFGIAGLAGLINIGNISRNIIGSDTAINKINITFRGTTTTASIKVYGISLNSTSYAGGIIQNNVVGGFTTTCKFQNTNPVAFVGILLSSTGLTANTQISNNIIGSASIENSIQHLSSSLAPCAHNAIYVSCTVPVLNVKVENNLIANFNNQLPSAIPTNWFGGINVGVTATVVTNGSLTITGNTIRDINTQSLNDATASDSISTIRGIILNSLISGTNSLIVSNNKIYSLYNNNTTPSIIVVNGIWCKANNDKVIIERNFIHSFQTTATNSLARQVGIYLGSTVSAGTFVRNNMIRLGIKPDGEFNNTSVNIYGIYKNTSVLQPIYFNTVFIAGLNVVSGSVNTYAFYKSISSGTEDIRNNIFVNARSNASGTGSHYAYCLNQTTNITSNNNLYFAPGVGGVIASVNNATSGLTLSGLKLALLGQDTMSTVGDPIFTTNALSNAQNASLAVAPNNSVAGAGVPILNVTTDYDNNIRNATPSVGAFGGPSLNPQNATTDIWAPTINNYVIIKGLDTNSVFTIDVKDIGVGVNTVGANAATMWYRNKTTNSDWQVVTGTLVNGNSSNGNYSFAPNYSQLTPAGVSVGNVIQYYFVAQDLATNKNIGYSSIDATGPVHNHVLNQITAPSNPLEFTIVSTGLTNTIHVPSGANSYPTLTGPTGVFNAINTGVLTGNTEIIITGNVTETGQVQLLNTGLNNNRLTIRSDGGSYVLSGNTATAATALITLNGVKNVTINGSDSLGTTRLLTIRNQNGSSPSVNVGPAIAILGNSTDIVLKNLILECNASTTTTGTIFIGSGTNNNIKIANNAIRGISNGTSNIPANAVYSNNTSNLNLTIGGTLNHPFGNVISNFSNAGVNLANYGVGVVIGNLTDSLNGNEIFNEASKSATPFYPIYLNSSIGGQVISRNKIYQTSGTISSATFAAIFCNTGLGGGNFITHNYIGGSNNTQSGSAMTISSATSLYLINYASGIDITNYISNNTIKNITISPLSNTGGILINSGLLEINNNNISDLTLSGGSFDGILATGITGNYTINNNIFNNFNHTNTGNYRLSGITITAGANTIITNNTISSLSSASTGIGLTIGTTIYWVYGIGVSSAGLVNIENNIINNIVRNNIGAAAYNMAAIVCSGLGIGSRIARNKIYGLTSFGTGTTTSAPQMWGIYLTSGIATIENNQISVYNDIALTQTRLRGLHIASTSFNQIWYNTIYVGGTSATANNSYCILRGTTGSYDMQNNILYNIRGGLGNHYAIGYGTAGNFYNILSNLYVTNNDNVMAENVTTAVNFETWKTLTLADNGSYYNTTFLPNDFFVNQNSGDLNVHTDYQRFATSWAMPIVGSTQDFNFKNRNNIAPTIGAFEYEIIYGLWRGGQNADFFNPINWSGNFVPNDTTNVTILNYAVNSPNINYGTAEVKNLTIRPTVTVTVSNGALFRIKGAIIATSNLIATDGIIEMAGDTAQDIPANTFYNNTISQLNINNSSGIQLFGTLNITNEVKPISGFINSNGNLKIVSTFANSARISEGNGTYIVGNVTIQRYIPAGTRRSRLLSLPASNVTLAQLIDNIYITGNNGQGGFDPTSSNAASAFFYNEMVNGSSATLGWQEMTDLLERISNGSGIRVVIMGDRSDIGRLNGTISDQNEVTLDVVGVPIQGDVVADFVTYTNNGFPTADGWNLMGNPYASSIDWLNIYSSGSFSNVEPTIYHRDAVSGAYVSWNASSQTGLGSRYINSFEGFFVKFTSTPSATFKESHKVANPGGAYFKKSQANTLTLKLTASETAYDLLLFKYQTNTSANFEVNEDSKKLNNESINMYSLSQDNVKLCTDLRDVLVNEATTKVRIGINAPQGNYLLNFSDLDNFENTIEIGFEDKYLNKIINLRKQLAYNFSITQDTSTFGENRFALIFSKNPLTIKLSQKVNPEITIYPNPINHNDNLKISANLRGIFQVKMYNQLGELALQTKLDFSKGLNQEIDLNSLKSGLYILEILNHDFNAHFKVVKN